MGVIVERWYAVLCRRFTVWVCELWPPAIARRYLPRDPVEMVLQKLAGPDRENAMEAAERKTDVYQGITVEDLEVKWQATVDGLAKEGIAVTNVKNALEGALSIR